VCSAGFESEVKAELRALRDANEALREKLNKLGQKFDKKTDDLAAEIEETEHRRKMASLRELVESTFWAVCVFSVLSVVVVIGGLIALLR
jgi:hypothetical protein